MTGQPAGGRETGREPGAGRSEEATQDAQLLQRILRFFGAAGELPRSDRYQITGRIGEGGMGIVMRALDHELGREVALKVARDTAGDASLRERFRAEARITGLLEHPNIVPVHELGLDDDGRPYFTMKLVQGRTLADPSMLAELSPERLAQVILRVCDALAFAHARGVVHRDLKPANVMVGSFGEVLVMDWGLAKQVGSLGGSAATPGSAPETAAGTVTLAGTVVGSPAYMPPEQARGELDAIDARTDVFGVGAILHEGLYGEPPYRGADRDEVLRRAAAAQRSEPGRRSAPRELAAIVERALQPDREARYPSIEDLAADLRAYLDGRRGSAWHDGLLASAVKLVRRRPARAIAAASAVLLGLTVWAAWGQLEVARLERQRRAELERIEADRTLLERLADLRSAGAASASVHNQPRYAQVVRNYLELFRTSVVPLDDETPLVAVVAELRRRGAASVELDESLHGALHDLARQLAHATSPPAMRSAAAEAVVGSAFWPRLVELIDRYETDPWRQAVWRAWRAIADGRPDAYEPLLAPEALAARSGRELEWLAEVVAFARGGVAVTGVLEQAIERDPGLYWAHFHRGLIAQEQRELRIADHHYRVAIALRPAAAWPRLNLAMLLAERGDLTGAIRHTAAVVAEHPQNSVARFFLGNHLRRARRLAEAAAEYEQAIALEPDFARALSNLGLVQLELGQREAAIASLRRALAIDPDPLIAENLEQLLKR
jgi:tetratricopeptide (TPR) repeat protein